MIPRPELTLPEAEAALLRDAYDRASVILEFGSGGSTILAAELGKRVISVESDKSWAQMMRDWLQQNPQPGQAEIVLADVGPTKEWGHPVDDRAWKRFARYPLEVWDLPDFAHPDVVLVDGRFRVGCALAAAYRITRPTTLYFDDYANRRDRFAELEGFIGAPARIVGRMAQFDLVPQSVPADRLLRILQLMQRP